MKQLPTFLFDFKDFVEELRNDEDKHEIINKFEQIYGNLEGKDYTDLPFYTDYLSKFVIDEELMKRIELPEMLTEDFDYELLLRLVAGSFSSNYAFKHLDKTESERLQIAVESNGQSIVKYLDELWSFQLIRLFEIYFEEQMNLAILMDNSKFEAEVISNERNIHLKAFEKAMALLQIDRASAPKRLERHASFLDLVNENDKQH